MPLLIPSRLIDLPIALKIRLMLLGTGFLALTISSFAFIAIYVSTARDQIIADLAILAETVASSSEAALLFNDERAVRDTLELLHSNPHICRARIVDQMGETVADFTARDDPGDSSACPPLQDIPLSLVEAGHVFKDTNLIMARPVRSEGNFLGAVIILEPMGFMYARIRGYLLTVFLIMAATAGVLLAISVPLQRILTDQILALATAATRISSEKNYSLRVKSTSRDEIGQLVESFNHMLAEIQARDNMLEQTVTERTRRLVASVKRLEEEVTERQRTEEMLITTNRQLQAILDHSPAAIHVVDREGRTILANHEFANLHGSTPEALKGKTALDLYPREQAKRILAEEARVLLTEQPHTSEPVVHFHDRSLTLVSAVFPLRDASGRVWAIGKIATDVTQTKRIQEEGLRASQLASLGELAASVAHEINNPVNGIINYAELLADGRTSEQTVRDIPQRIITEGERIAAIVRSLLSYARTEKEIATPASVAEILTESLTLTQARLGKDGIELVRDLPPDLPLVRVRAREIQQVFMNLLTNARHALNQKTLAPGEEKRIEISAHPAGEMVRVVVRDNGVGIAPGLLPRVTEPFFTTKPKNQGTGLGLSISRRIVEEHGGRLSVGSMPGNSTTVTLELPAA